MREYPITVPSHVYHINSSASNIFDVDQYQRKLLASDQPSDGNRRFHPSLATVSYPNKNHSNYNCTSNGDLSSTAAPTTITPTPSGYRVQNSTGNNIGHHNNYNRTNKNAIKRSNNKNSDRFHDENASGSGNNASYSILDAITNAVTTGNCSSTVYPLNEDDDDDGDGLNDTADISTNANTSNRRHYLTDDKLYSTDVTRCHADQLQSIQMNPPSHLNNSDEQFQRYNYSFSNNRPHQFPSVNYKHSYLLWIGTPVAAR